MPDARMILFYSSRSPFVRKVSIVAEEAGLSDRIDRTPVTVTPRKLDPTLMAHNPLVQLPTLLTPSGEALFGSSVVCEYLDALAGSRLFPAPGPDRWKALRRQAAGDGVLDFAIALRGELRKSAEARDAVMAESYRIRIEAVLALFESEAATLAAEPFSIGHVGIGCALGYLDFRLPELAWREGRGKLARWCDDDFATRPSALAHPLVDPS